MSSHNSDSEKTLGNRLREAGNIFLTLFGAIGMVGIIGASTMTVLKGPVKTMSQVTKRTIAENNMIATGKLALISAVATQADDGDCDADNMIEPVPFGAAVSGFTGGGAVPSAIGTAKEDPWGRPYGYCVWDHGSVGADAGDNDANCGGSTNFLAGGDVETEYVLAIVSAGPDGTFNTSCVAFVDANSDDIPDTPLVNKLSGSDDLILGYTYGEAGAMAGGIWEINNSNPNLAEISKDLNVTDSSDVVQLAFDSTAGNLRIGGTGQFPKVNTDNIQSYTGAGGTITVDSTLDSNSDITTTADISANDLAASGTLGVTGNSTLGGTLGVTGNTTIGGTLGAGNATLGTLNAGTSTLGALTANATTLGSLGVTGAATVGTTLGVTGASTIGGTLGVTGVTTVGGLNLGANVIRMGTDNLQTLYGNNSAYLYYDSNHSTVTGIILRDKENTRYGTLYGSGDGANFGLLDGDSNWSILAVKDAYTNFKINNINEMTLYPTYLNLYTNKITNLGAPTNAADATTKSYVDTHIAAGTGYSETDPQVGDISTANRWCYSDGTEIICDKFDPSSAGHGDNLGDHIADQSLNMSNYNIDNVAFTEFNDVAGNAPVESSDTLGGLVCADGQLTKWQAATTSWICANDTGIASETDPQVSAVTNGKWCRGNGSAVTCDQNAPSGGDNLGNHTAAQNLVMGAHATTSSAGTIRDANGGWVRTYGNTGWYNGTHGGGWYMVDANYLRNYGSRGVHVTTGAPLISVTGINTGANYGVYGQSAGNYGVYGKTTSAGHGGVLGYTADASKYGILGHANAYSFYGSGALYNSGNATITGNVTATAYFHSSDARLKENITTITDPWAILNGVHGVTYNWKKDGVPSAGVIAQDLEKVFPRAVATGDDGMLAVEYDQLIAPLIEAVKAQQVEIEILKKEMKALKAKK